MGGESGVPSEGADCVGGPTDHLTADANSCASKDEHSHYAVAIQQDDNGRSGGPSNKINMECSTDHIKGNIILHAWISTTVNRQIFVLKIFRTINFRVE